MKRNLHSPAATRRATRPMAEHDALPVPLRRFAAQAALPWSAGSLRRLWRRALAEEGSEQAALARLARAEAAMLRAEARSIWGPDYPGLT